jgi:hypothetical protein
VAKQGVKFVMNTFFQSLQKDDPVLQRERPALSARKKNRRRKVATRSKLSDAMDGDVFCEEEALERFNAT